MEDERIGLAEVLAAAEDAAPVASLDVVARNLRDRFGARYVSFLFLDIVGRKVVRVTEETGTRQGRRSDRVPLAGSVYEDVLRTQKLIRVDDGATGSGSSPRSPTGATPSASWSCSCPRSPTTSWSRSERPRTRWPTSSSPTAASPICTTGAGAPPRSPWPPRSSASSALGPSMEAAEFALACALVPADSVAGDTYDYALDQDTLHLSITDAMGHDVDASLMATLLVNASRGARRDGADLAEQARRTHQALLDHGRRTFATGQLLRIALDGSGARLVNAGHLWPLRLRDGRVGEVPWPSTCPSASPRRPPTGCRTSTWDPATASCSTPTARRSAGPSRWTCPA